MVATGGVDSDAEGAEAFVNVVEVVAVAWERGEEDGTDATATGTAGAEGTAVKLECERVLWTAVGAGAAVVAST